jgi:hypothetical protein
VLFLRPVAFRARVRAAFLPAATRAGDFREVVFLRAVDFLRPVDFRARVRAAFLPAATRAGDFRVVLFLRDVVFLRPVLFLRPVVFRAVDFLRPVDFLRVAVLFRPVVFFLAVDFLRPVVLLRAGEALLAVVFLRPVAFLRAVDLFRPVDFLLAVDLRPVLFFRAVDFLRALVVFALVLGAGRVGMAGSDGVTAAGAGSPGRTTDVPAPVTAPTPLTVSTGPPCSSPGEATSGARSPTPAARSRALSSSPLSSAMRSPPTRRELASYLLFPLHGIPNKSAEEKTLSQIV